MPYRLATLFLFFPLISQGVQKWLFFGINIDIYAQIVLWDVANFAQCVEKWTILSVHNLLFGHQTLVLIGHLALYFRMLLPYLLHHTKKDHKFLLRRITEI